MNKIVKISTDEIIYDYKNASKVVEKACLRQTPMSVVGLLQRDKSVFICLEEQEENYNHSNAQYIFSPFDEENEDFILSEIKSRYNAGFSTIGCIIIDGQTWGLFTRKKVS